MVKRIFSCWLLVLLMIGAAGLSVRAVADSMDGQWKADHVLVVKGERKLHLLRNGIVLRSFDISLGKNPLGAKMQEVTYEPPKETTLLIGAIRIATIICRCTFHILDRGTSVLRTEKVSTRAA